MINFTKYITIGISASLLLSGFQLVEAKEKKAKGAAPTSEEAFAKFDANSDSMISSEEYLKNMTVEEKKVAAEAAFKTADANADGKLSLEEFKTIPKKKAPKEAKEE